MGGTLRGLWTPLGTTSPASSHSLSYWAEGLCSGLRHRESLQRQSSMVGHTQVWGIDCQNASTLHSPTSHYGHNPDCEAPESSLAFPRAHHLPLWRTVSLRSLELGEGVEKGIRELKGQARATHQHLRVRRKLGEYTHPISHSLPHSKPCS